MVTDSFIALACAGLIAFLFGITLTFAGYRFFMFLLPVWGFFFGLYLGAQSVQALFGDAFLATITSWVVGFVVAVAFAVLSYLFYFMAVAVIGGAVGYYAMTSILLALGAEMSWWVWLLGIIVGVALAVVTIVFNLQKWVVIIGTSLLGAAVVFGGFFVIFYPISNLLENPIKEFLQANPFLMILTIVLAILGIISQIRQSNKFKLEAYNNW
jgi:hypothetical protein